MMAARILFSGTIRVTPAPPVKSKCQPCAVCGCDIPFDGIHISGEVMNPEVCLQATARWRLGTETWFEGDSELAEKHVPKTLPIDIFVHDTLCLATIFRNHLNAPCIIV
ncbi:MAG: hypothetical protein A3I44_05090 [Candidatus Sungbacteria bacterium RIFCSPLOWO2_02_FULL_51_17]|nr:MAG: hypothetical protein A3I44_05090 [Candidatus Sungbacteria bacterium RIFCSPLOWO2_02_FULL_51_17]